MINFNLIKNWVSKKVFPLCFGFLFLALFLLWPFSTLAFWETLKNAILFVPYALITLLLLLAVVASQAFAWLTGYILDTAISPTLISLSYTNPAANQIIKSGLNITQSFVNLLLVVALVYTALSIALRINETGAKKMLARLIIVALLVNFAPVFCGLIVDASNIVMYYFLKPIEEGVSGVLTQVGPLVDMVYNTIWQAKVNITERLGVIMMGITQIILNFAMGVAFLLFAGIFLVRYVAIWTSVILAPIAFVAWIFPAGRMRAFWDMWLNQFIQWSIIGIPIAFFLYLAMGSFSLITAAFQQKIAMSGIEAPVIGYFNQVFPYFVVIVFLYLGFTIGLQTGAMGATTTINLTKRAGKLGAEATRRTTGAILGARGKEWMEKQAGAKFMPEKIAEMKGVKGLLAKAAYGITTPVTGTYWALRRGVGETGLRLVEVERKNIKAAEEKYKGTMAERKLAGLRDAMKIGDFKKAVGILRQGIEEGQIGDLRKLGLTDSEIKKLGRSALKTHPEEFKKIRDAFPSLSLKMAEGFSDSVKEKVGLTFDDEAEAKKFNNEIERKILVKLTPAKIEKVDVDELVSEKGLGTFVEHGTAEQIMAAARYHAKKYVDTFNNFVGKYGKDNFKAINPTAYASLTSTPAQTLGFNVIVEEKSEEPKSKL